MIADTKARAWKELIADLREHNAIAITQSQYETAESLSQEVLELVRRNGSARQPTSLELTALVGLARKWVKAAKGEG